MTVNLPQYRFISPLFFPYLFINMSIMNECTRSKIFVLVRKWAKHVFVLQKYRVSLYLAKTSFRVFHTWFMILFIYFLTFPDSLWQKSVLKSFFMATEEGSFKGMHLKYKPMHNTGCIKFIMSGRDGSVGLVTYCRGEKKKMVSMDLFNNVCKCLH